MMISRCTKAIAVIVAVSCLAACGGGSSTPPPPAAGPGTFSGVVTESNGTTPIDGATVRFTSTSGTEYEATSGADGSYTLDVPGGTYDMRAWKGTTEYDDFTQSGVSVAGDGAETQDVVLQEAANYVGSATCGTVACHQDIYNQFLQSGHPYKLNEVSGAAPSYPFTSLAGVDALISDDGLIEGTLADPNGTLTDNTLGIDQNLTTWSDLTYVIGGFFWKARFLDANGFIVTGSDVQWNFATAAMSGYHNNEVDKPYNCGNCHTTGWRHYDATDNPLRQDNLDGMDGTFEAPGVHCEACHGAGSRHASSPSASNITKIATARTDADYAHGRMGWGIPAACGDCHTRDGEDDYPTFQSAYNTALIAASKPTVAMGGRIAASGGLVKHHEQYDELLGVDPDTLDSTRTAAFMSAHGNCSTCHKMNPANGLGGPHGSTVHQGDVLYTGEPGVQGSTADCLVCHADNNPSLRTGGMTTLDCVDCHMPKMAKSATSTVLANTVDPVTVGDVSSHIFGINVGTAAEQFTTDGSFSYPFITVDWACRTCHGIGALFDVSASDTFIFHNNK